MYIIYTVAKLKALGQEGQHLALSFMFFFCKCSKVIIDFRHADSI